MARVAAVFLMLGLLGTLANAGEDPAEAEKQEALRAQIPLGGNFSPAPEQGVFVAAGHGLRVVASRDDGLTWQEVYFGFPGGDHGRWAVWNSVAYTGGVFAIAAGWGGPGTIIASDDGKNWRHLTDGQRKPSRKGTRPYDMPTTMQLLGVNGSFIMPLEATPDFGRSWFSASPYGFTDATGAKVKVDLSHPSLACGEHAGKQRIIVVGDSGPSLISDDLGKTWVPLSVSVTPWPERGAKGIIAKGSVFLLLKGEGDNVLRSVDGGQTWAVHPLGVKRPAGRSFSLSVVGDEFWICGETAKASSDGITWRDLPRTTPPGRVATSETGTLINIDRARLSIMRSTDQGQTWNAVYTYTAHPDAHGGAQGLAGIAYGKVKALR